MFEHSKNVALSDILSPELERGFRILLEALHLASDASSNRWDFAISIRQLQESGLRDWHLRWLTVKGFAEHAQEVTVEGDDGRAFRSTGNLTFRRKNVLRID